MYEEPTVNLDEETKILDEETKSKILEHYPSIKTKLENIMSLCDSAITYLNMALTSSQNGVIISEQPFGEKEIKENIGLLKSIITVLDIFLKRCEIQYDKIENGDL